MARRKSRMLGQARAGDMNPMWGAVAAGTIGTGTAVGVQSFTGMDKHSELIGLGAGVATGVALMLSERTRAAGFAGVLTSFVTSGVRYAQSLVSAKQQIKDITGAGVTFQAKAGISPKSQLEAAKQAAAAAGFGMVTATNMPTLGARSAQRVPSLGAISAQQVPVMSGGMGIVSPEQVPTLGQAPTRANVQMQGPVTFEGLAGHYGATIYGNN